MKCDISFSLDSVSTLYRRSGHFCHVCVKHFFPFTTVQKLLFFKSIEIFQSYDHKCTVHNMLHIMYCHFFMVHSKDRPKTGFTFTAENETTAESEVHFRPKTKRKRNFSAVFGRKRKRKRNYVFSVKLFKKWLLLIQHPYHITVSRSHVEISR